MDHENDLGDVRFTMFRVGVVTRRDDPENLGRVKFRIPGLIEPESAWALPLGTFGGGAQRGLKMVPPIGAEVGVVFNGGDVDAPYYLGAQWGKPDAGSEMPTDCKDVSEQPEDVHCLETSTWAITLDDRKGHENLVIRNKTTGDAIEMDGVTPGIQIKARAALLIQVDGLFSVDASSVILNGRKLSDGGQGF